MVCDVCGAAMAQVSGKGGGYYGCLSARKGACTNRLLVIRNVCERIILSTVGQRLASTGNLMYIMRKVEAEIHRSSSNLPTKIRLNKIELAAEERRIANFV